MISSRFPVGIEEGEGGAVVHALTLPGCVARGATPALALDAFTDTLRDWLAFLESVGEPVPQRDADLEVVVEEWIRTDADLAAGEGDVCFEADREPIDDIGIAEGLRRLGALRARLLPFVRRAKDLDLEAKGAPEWNARIILDELARAQWWTLTRLGASPLAEVPEGTVARLDTAMALVVQRVGHLDAGARDLTLLLDGEEWTPRRVLRRLLWLEWTLGGVALDALESSGAAIR